MPSRRYGRLGSLQFASVAGDSGSPAQSLPATAFAASLQGAVIAAVELQPDGLVFAVPATIDILMPERQGRPREADCGIHRFDAQQRHGERGYGGNRFSRSRRADMRRRLRRHRGGAFP